MKGYSSGEAEQLLIQMIEQEQAQLYRMAYSYVKNEHDAMDVVQEAVYKAILHQDQIKELSYMKTWLIRILINTAQDMLKKNQRIVAVAPEEIHQNIDGEMHILGSQDAAGTTIDLKEAMEGLDLRQRQILELRFFEDFKLEEIAQIMAMPVNTVKTTLYRTLKLLRLELEGGEVCE